ncbi:serine--tRNA ligase [SAR202 cluster bacterium AD-804-J14_MRT_500m]|nr:serine--tRNA ligase [SAR202 cluster bacterium AD-804-J14_MRT_500m]
MISIEKLRQDPEGVRSALRRRGEVPDIDQILSLDEERRNIIVEGDALRATRNDVSREIGQMSGDRSALVEQMRDVGSKISTLTTRQKSIEEALHEALLQLPNLPHHDVPDGLTEENNIVVRSWGQPHSFKFDPMPHWELGEKLGIIDFQRGVKLSGSRFFVLMDQGSRLERALITFMLDLHSGKHGYKETTLPAMVRRDVMEGSGNLPKFGDNLYHDEEDDLWLVPTAEVPLTNLHRDEILAPGVLPLKYVASSPCFRREKAAAGRDTRGIKRVHQFQKVELYKFVRPEQSEDELESLVADAEAVCQLLELPYRVLQLCAGELSFSSSKSYDLEIWAPGSEEWLEVSSCSNCIDFQARRSGIRYRSAEGSTPQPVHTLNGSGLALPRVIIALLENGQQPDGSVSIPQVLHPYTGFDVIEPK